jgi:hypothetical protein
VLVGVDWIGFPEAQRKQTRGRLPKAGEGGTAGRLPELSEK